MTSLQDTFFAAESAWKASQDAPHEFLDANADERARLHAEYLTAAFAWINEPSPAPIPTPDTQIDPVPATSNRSTGTVTSWDRTRGCGIIQYDGGLISFYRAGLTQAYTPGIGDSVTFRVGVSAGYGEVNERAVGIVCTDLPMPTLSASQVKAREEARKRESLLKTLEARRLARMKERGNAS